MTLGGCSRHLRFALQLIQVLVGVPKQIPNGSRTANLVMHLLCRVSNRFIHHCDFLGAFIFQDELLFYLLPDFYCLIIIMRNSTKRGLAFEETCSKQKENNTMTILQVWQEASSLGLAKIGITKLPRKSLKTSSQRWWWVLKSRQKLTEMNGETKHPLSTVNFHLGCLCQFYKKIWKKITMFINMEK